jgi:hypothetical protein
MTQDRSEVENDELSRHFAEMYEKFQQMSPEERAEHTIVLSDEQFDQMMERVNNPDPTPNPAMQELLRRKRIWDRD